MSKPAWRHVAANLAVVLVVAVLGALFGRPALFVVSALALLLVLELRNLLRFEHWLRHRRTEPPPDMTGLWGEVIATTSRLYRRKVFHKRRVLGMFREFRRMTAAMPDGVVLLGPGREILWLNRTASRWLDLRRKVDRGLRIDHLVRHPAFVEYVERGGAPPRVHLSTQGDRWLEFHLVRGSDSALQLLIVRDVTSEARLDAMRRDFVANASHELRSPLTVISGYLDALAEDPALDAAWREPVLEMQRQSDRMRAVVQDLLELSRLESQAGAAGHAPVDVGGMLALIRKDVLAGPAHPATVSLVLDTDAQLLGSETELHSAFANLVSNAVKYTPSDGTIEIRWWVDAQGGHVAVRDTGIGIPAEHLPRLTERFYRVDAGRSRRLGGSGLGLAIVKHALQRHDAWLEIESEEGRGSTFTCRFPAARVQSRPTRTPATSL